MPTPFPTRKEMITGNKNKKMKKKKSKKNIIDIIPDIPSHDQDSDVNYAVTYTENGGTGNDGSSACPIYVSDFEDSSEVAVRGYGDRNGMYKDFAKNSLPVVTPGHGRSEQPRKEPSSMLKAKPQTMTPEEKKANKKTKRAEMKQRIAKLSTRSKSREKTPVIVDVTGLDDEVNSVLEKELEEITLNGRRSGLISGTPEKAAYDIENGKLKKGWKKVNWKKAKKQKQKNLQSHREDKDDEKDKSWFAGTLTKDLDAKPTLHKKNMTSKMVWLAAVVASIVLISIGIANQKKARKPGKVLTQKQAQIQGILTRVTGEKTLSEDGTAQNLARNWLLLEDKESKSTTSEESIIQRFALASFYFATTSGDGGSGKNKWEEDNWLKGPECGDEDHAAWFGIDCNSDGEVRTLAMDNNGLSGTIPSEVGHLYKLENLILKNNPNLMGWIPASLSHLANLRQLGLYNNNLSGVIPDIFERTKSLKFINLEGNDIHGSIPLEISHLKSLETLVLKNNRMEGIVPFKQLAETSIKYLGLSHNRFASRIERAIYGVDTLEYLYLDNNAMSGPIPPAIGNLSHLKAIDLGNNEFTGFFPGTVGNLERLEYLSLNNNKFNENVARRIRELTKLSTLNLASNLFTGTLPDLSALTNLKTLHLFENEFTGTLPQFLTELQSIESLFLSSNQFTGTIPESLSLMSRTLTGLYLSDNLFEGTIPTHLCEFIGLEALFLDTNQLTGSIPACFGALSDLQQLYLFTNKLTGTVPAQLQGLKQLTGFGIEHNNIVGEVPDEVCELVHHQKADMWADCAVGEDALDCPCCSVCCPGDSCI